MIDIFVSIIMQFKDVHWQLYAYIDFSFVLCTSHNYYACIKINNMHVIRFSL